VAMLVGLEGGQASTWSIYSESVKPGERIQGDNEYNFYEGIVDALRPGIREGVKTILVAAPDGRDYEKFMDHIGKHQGWLLRGWRLNTVTFERILEPAMSVDQVRGLVKSHGFKGRLSEVTWGDISQVMGVLERRLSDPGGIETLLFALGDVEDAVYGGERSLEYILVTEVFRSRNRRRVERLLQVAGNKGVRTRIVRADTSAGARISQFGGLVCMLGE
jgi:stalled ribosome rescue protein Dom34